MATRTWQGGTTDYATAGNWVEGAVPIAGDNVYVKAHPTTGVSWDIATSLNQSAVAIASFSVDPNYTGDVGSDDGSAYLQINTTGKVYLWGGGSASVDMSAAAVAEIDVRGSSTTGNHYLKGGTSGSSTRALLLRVHQGAVEWVSGDCVQVFISFLSSTVGGPTFVWRAGTMGGTGAIALVLAGTIEVYAGTFAPLYQYAGQVTIYDGTCTSPLIFGGEMDYRSTTAGGTVQIFNDAEITFSEDIRPKTITRIIAGGECTVNVDNPNLTITNGIDKIGAPIIIGPKTQRAVGIA